MPARTKTKKATGHRDYSSLPPVIEYLVRKIEGRPIPKKLQKELDDIKRAAKRTVKGVVTPRKPARRRKH